MSDETSQQLPKPGPQHELLTPFVGVFRAQVFIYGRGGEPFQSEGTMTNDWVLEGLYLRSEYQGDSPGDDVPSFAGYGYWGYDFNTAEYTSVWIDNASTFIQKESGSVNDSGDTWEMHSEINHPSVGQMTKRSVVRVIDENHHEMESFLTMPGADEMKSMKITYSRV